MAVSNQTRRQASRASARLAEQRIAETRKRILDLQEQTEQAFEYEDRLAELSRRQSELEDSLYLTTNQNSHALGATPMTMLNVPSRQLDV